MNRLGGWVYWFHHIWQVINGKRTSWALENYNYVIWADKLVIEYNYEKTIYMVIPVDFSIMLSTNTNETNEI